MNVPHLVKSFLHGLQFDLVPRIEALYLVREFKATQNGYLFEQWEIANR